MVQGAGPEPLPPPLHALAAHSRWSRKPRVAAAHEEPMFLNITFVYLITYLLKKKKKNNTQSHYDHPARFHLFYIKVFLKMFSYFLHFSLPFFGFVYY